MLPNNQFPSDQPLGSEQLKTVWDLVSGDLRAALGEATFDLWFSRSCLTKVAENQAVLTSPGSMYAIWIEENFREVLKLNLNKYLLDLKGFSVLSEEMAEQPEEQLSGEDAVESNPPGPVRPAGKRRKSKKPKAPLSPEELLEKGLEAGLNETYRFDTFIVGTNSRLAHAAACSVLDSPGTTYQPLFYHSASGMGKTHLLHAIGWEFLNRRHHANVLYVSAEKFANEYIDAIRNSKDIAFRKKYREVDLLLLDDVQFLGGKSGFQTEFYHTFNSIIDQRNQVVIASDCLASEITQLEERLVSRLQWGMTVEIHPPDPETSEAILRQKRDNWQMKVSDQVISKIVAKITRNVRQLEGALVRAAMVGSLNGGEVTDTELEELLADMISESPGDKLGLEQIKEATADYFGVEVRDLEGKRRMTKITQARQVAMFLCRELTTHSLKEIAMSFGKDHASVVYGVKNTKKKCESSESLRNSVEILRRRLTRGGIAGRKSGSLGTKSAKSEPPSESGRNQWPVDLNDGGDFFG